MVHSLSEAEIIKKLFITSKWEFTMVYIVRDKKQQNSKELLVWC